MKIIRPQSSQRHRQAPDATGEATSLEESRTQLISRGAELNQTLELLVRTRRAKVGGGIARGPHGTVWSA